MNVENMWLWCPLAFLAGAILGLICAVLLVAWADKFISKIDL